MRRGSGDDSSEKALEINTNEAAQSGFTTIELLELCKDQLTTEAPVRLPRGIPEGEQHANVIATGTSQVTRRPFNLIVAFEQARDRHVNMLGRVVA